MAERRQDQEIQQYRDLMKAPDRFEDGFGPKMIFAAIFLGFVMVPGSIYLSLFMGTGLGPAAQWVTVILFAEVARRSMKELRVQEIFLLYYMAGIALSGGILQGGLISQLLWNQYLVQSQAAISMGVAQEIPWWVAPQLEEIEAAGRTFFTRAWLGPILFIVGLMLVQRIDHFGLGYTLYRLTAHVEKLPFPMAPVGALAVTALAESRANRQPWRWRCFSLGGVIGIAFGAVYIGIPTITGAFFGESIRVLPIPWLDFTPAISTPDFMPAVPLNISFDATFLIIGMVLPFWAVMGGLVGLLATWIMAPFLYKAGVLTSWQPGMRVVDTLYSNNIDFFLSLNIGLMFAIFLVSLYPLIRMIMRGIQGRRSPEESGTLRASLKELFTRNRERGDLPILISLSIYVFSAISYILICVWLMPGDPETGAGRFPWLFFLGFAFIYQPIISYVNAKLEGMVGQNVQLPLVQQAAYILSGYKGAEIWFAPIPLNDYSHSVREFRILELTGTRLFGIIKVELLAIPILLVSSFLFCELIWRLAPIPSEAYPFTEEVWRLQALNFSLMATSTMEGSSPFMEALKFDVVGYGLIGGVIAFTFLTFLGLPTFLVYGAVRGLNQTQPGGILLEVIGALIGRLYLQRKFGHQLYKQYVMVIFAGFSAGMGLSGMASVALVLIANSMTTVGY